MNHAADAPAPPADAPVAFEFVKALAMELSAGKVDLPSFPDIAVRVRRALADENAKIEQIVRVVGSEAALAAKLLKMANSVALNRTGKQLTDLRTAINRMGYNMVRSAAISFAMAQIRNANKLQGLESYLEDLWKQSTHVAAISFVLARKCTKLNPDEAMLTGLLHGIGKLYILTRAEKHLELFQNPAALNEVVRDWHAEIGKAIIENWEFSEAMAQAVAEQNVTDRIEDVPPDLRDVICVAILMSSLEKDPTGLEAVIQKVSAAWRLGLNSKKTMEVLSESTEEINALRQALGA
jgi:HD-like signal output (HDOD) protein